MSYKKGIIKKEDSREMLVAELRRVQTAHNLNNFTEEDD